MWRRWLLRHGSQRVAAEDRRGGAGMAGSAPSGYGGIERVVSVLTEGLVAAGHDVTLFAAAGSGRTPGRRSSRSRAHRPSAISRP